MERALDDESAVVGTIGSIGDVAQVRSEMLDCGDVSVCSVKPMNQVYVLLLLVCLKRKPYLNKQRHSTPKKKRTYLYP